MTTPAEFNARRAFLQGASLAGATAAITMVTGSASAETPAPAQAAPHLRADMVTGPDRANGGKRVLVVVDYQVDFVNGSLGNDNAPKIEDAVAAKITAAQAAGEPIFYTMDTHPADTYELTREGKRVRAHCIEGTAGWELYGKVDALLKGKATMVKKGTYGSMELPKLIDHLIHQGTTVTQIELIGVATTACVINNAIILFNAFPEARILISRGATASKTMEAQDAVLDQLTRFGMEIVD